ncbi:hypothetical protein AGOR_G00133550 [Albula goreensis]|uniref:Ig-like domain-containing protein n=1 Tax=Albula goreensis TaxID=1534307 RepID=A0A8T3D849_9TELE|nr:hypothetical protein AGOR_G00133550 [Albula goreensis]
MVPPELLLLLLWILPVSGQLVWPSGQSLTVRCHYDASLRQTEKLWCLQTMPNECQIMGGMYFCAAQYGTEVVLQGSLRVRVSDDADPRQLQAHTTITTTTEHITRGSEVTIIYVDERMVDEQAKGSESTAGVSPVYVEIILVLLTLFTIVICVKVVAIYREAKDIRRKIPLTMTRITRHDATENVYTPSPRLTTGVSTVDHSRMTQVTYL